MESMIPPLPPARRLYLSIPVDDLTPELGALAALTGQSVPTLCHDLLRFALDTLAATPTAARPESLTAPP